MTTPLVGLLTGKAHQGRSSARIPANAPSEAIRLLRHNLRGSGSGAYWPLDLMKPLTYLGLTASTSLFGGLLSGGLLLGGLLFAPTLYAQASTPLVNPTLQPEMVVTATREPIPVNQAIADVTVIGSAEIQRHPSRNLAELLAQQAGLEISMSGGLGATSSAFIRGTNSNHLLVLIDGMRFGSATAGNPALENIPLGQIERIEIVRGPMSSLYGSDALGGVIQVFTKTGEGLGNQLIANAQLGLGSQGFGQIATGFAGRQDAFDYSLQMQHTRNTGFSATHPKAPFGNYHPDTDGLRQNSISLNLGYRFNRDWALRFSAMNSQARSEFDEGFDPANPLQSGITKAQAQSLALSLNGRFGPNWLTTFSLGQSKDLSDTVGALNSYYIGIFATKQTQFSWLNRLSTSIGTWSIGLEHLKQSVSLIDLASPTDPIPTANFSPDQRTVQSAWVGWNMQRGDWQWQTSLRNDDNSQYGSKSTGNLGLAYRLSPSWRLQASLASGFSAPSFNNLYYPGFSNPKLKPESSLSREIGFRYTGNLGRGSPAGPISGTSHPSELKVVYFSQTIRDLIVFDLAKGLPGNLDTGKIHGFSAQLRHRTGPWNVNASLDLTQPINDSAGAQQDNLLPRRARQNLRLSADYDFGTWQLGGGLRAAGRRYDDAANTTALGGYTLMDARARMLLHRDWSIALNLNNLSNKAYETVHGFNQAGRQVFFTLNFQPKP